MTTPLVEPFERASAETLAELRQGAARRGAIGYFCSHTPLPLIHAAGYQPLRLLGGGGAITRADGLTPAFICPFLRLAVDRAMGNGFDFLRGVVQGYTCDAACGVANIWAQNFPAAIHHVLPLPYDDTPAARRFLAAALGELAVKLGDVEPEALEQSLALYGAISRRIDELDDLRAQRRLPLCAADFLRVMSAGFSVPPRRYLALLEALLETVDDLPPASPPGQPVLVLGSVVEDPAVLAAVEAAGLAVTADDLCCGPRHWAAPEGQGPDPMARLIDQLLRRPPCPARASAESRLPRLLAMAQGAGVRGVVFVFQKFCTPHLSDHPALSQALRAAGLPSVAVELPETGLNQGQLRTRLEAFVEMLEG